MVKAASIWLGERRGSAVLHLAAEGRDSGRRECEIFPRCGLHFAYKSACLRIYDCNLHFKSHQYLRRSVSHIYVAVWERYIFLLQNKKLKKNSDLSDFSDPRLHAVTYLGLLCRCFIVLFSALCSQLRQRLRC